MNYKNLIFDFDGVLAESNEIRFNGFHQLFESFPKHQVDQLVSYARANGGVSRYEKIRYFFEEIRGESVSAKKVNKLASQFSNLVRQKVIDSEPVKGSLKFLEENCSKYNFALVSGSDQAELRVICHEKKIDHFFKVILGSPIKKEDNIARLLDDLEWKLDETVYIGDSNNDLEASWSNNIDFIGRDSGLVDWTSFKVSRILDLSELEEILSKIK